MRLDCEIIEDLLPLYLDDICSEQSREIVEEHLAECEKCRSLIESTQSVQIPHIEPEKPAIDKAVKKSFKKIRFRWWASVVAILILIPAIYLGWNQYHGHGISYTNIYEMYIGNAFMKCLEKGDYEKAYKYIDIDGKKQEWLKDGIFDEEKLENMKSDGLAKFCDFGKKLEENGGISGYEYVAISNTSKEDDGTTIYQMIFKVNIADTKRFLEVMVSNEGVEYLGTGGSYITDPLAQFTIWSEYLWRDYEGGYLDIERGEYVYPNK